MPVLGVYLSCPLPPRLCHSQSYQTPSLPAQLFISLLTPLSPLDVVRHWGEAGTLWLAASNCLPRGGQSTKPRCSTSVEQCGAVA